MKCRSNPKIRLLSGHGEDWQKISSLLNVVMPPCTWMTSGPVWKMLLTCRIHTSTLRNVPVHGSLRQDWKLVKSESRFDVGLPASDCIRPTLYRVRNQSFLHASLHPVTYVLPRIVVARNPTNHAAKHLSLHHVNALQLPDSQRASI